MIVAICGVTDVEPLVVAIVMELVALADSYGTPNVQKQVINKLQ